MIRILSLSICLGSLLSCGLAVASEDNSVPSRGFQIARRVAQLENQKDLPSRAVWLSNRVIDNDRSLAYFEEGKPKAHAKKRSATVKN